MYKSGIHDFAEGTEVREREDGKRKAKVPALRLHNNQISRV